MVDTISSSGNLSSLLGIITLAEDVVIEQKSGGDTPVVVTTSSTLGLDLADSITVENNATLILSSPINADVLAGFTIGSEGTLVLDSGLSAGILSNISFLNGASDAVLKIEPGVSLSLLSDISGFAATDSIDFAGSGTPASATSLSETYNGLTNQTQFTVTLSGGSTDVFSLAGNLTAEHFMLAADSTGTGFNLTAETPCFAEGTLILTAQGNAPVETLLPGDIVILANGTSAPITFIGHRRMVIKTHPDPAQVRPIRVCAGALGDHMPERDLLLSPEHALYLDGVLVPVRALVNGVSIAPDLSIERIRYFHIELPQHGILIAEGAPAESFLDLGHRGLFENAEEPFILFPTLVQDRGAVPNAAPFVDQGEKLLSIRTRLAARTEQRLKHLYAVR